MYIVAKYKEHITVPEKSDATRLVFSMQELDCGDELTIKKVIGSQEDADKYLVKYGDYEITVFDKGGALTIAKWLLVLGIDSISIERMGNA